MSEEQKDSEENDRLRNEGFFDEQIYKEHKKLIEEYILVDCEECKDYSFIEALQVGSCKKRSVLVVPNEKYYCNVFNKSEESKL